MPPSPSPIAADRLLWKERLVGGGHWSGVLRRRQALRLVDLEGRANVAAVFYNRDQPLERINVPDTLKAQHTAHLTKGHVLYSDMGCVLCSIVADDVGWHDPLGPPSTLAQCEQRYGPRAYQEFRNDMLRSGRDGLLIELGKWGLGQRDLVPGVNFFSKLLVDDAGRIQFVPNHSRAGACVDLRFEMDTLVVVSSAPHAFDPAPEWQPGPVLLQAWRADAPAADDFCRTFRPENVRGFENTERLFRGT